MGNCQDALSARFPEDGQIDTSLGCCMRQTLFAMIISFSRHFWCDAMAGRIDKFHSSSTQPVQLGADRGRKSKKPSPRKSIFS